MDLNRLQEWVAEGRKDGVERCVKIDLDSSRDPTLIVGQWFSREYFCQIITEVDQIDLEGKLESNDREEFRRLSEKYGKQG